MIRGMSAALAITLSALASSNALAQNVRYYEDNGIQYRETTQTTQRPITETKYEPREITTTAPRYTTEMQDSVRTYQVPVTEQQWVPGYQRTWNIFAPPVLSYRLMPVTRWETRTETVKVPLTRVEYVPQKQVQHYPVTNTRMAQEQVVRREAIGPATGVLPAASGGTAIARAQPNDTYNSSSPTPPTQAAAPADPYAPPTTSQGKLQ